MSTEKSNTRLLIVEDDVALQKQIKWSLDSYESVTAEDREGALSQVRRHAPAVVTMDLGLPPHADDAVEGFALLRANPGGSTGHTGHRADGSKCSGECAASSGDGGLRLLGQAVRA